MFLWYSLHFLFSDPPVVSHLVILPVVCPMQLVVSLLILNTSFIKVNSSIKYNLLLHIKWFLFCCVFCFIHSGDTPPLLHKALCFWRLFKDNQAQNSNYTFWLVDFIYTYTHTPTFMYVFLFICNQNMSVFPPFFFFFLK